MSDMIRSECTMSVNAVQINKSKNIFFPVKHRQIYCTHTYMQYLTEVIVNLRKEKEKKEISNTQTEYMENEATTVN